jgi:L-rhamnose mutarotase
LRRRPGGISLEVAMKRTAFLAVLLVSAASITALAQDAKPYKDGPVSDVSYIRTKPGQFDNYMKWLAGPWKNLMDAQKKAGLVSDYAVYMTEPATPNDPNLILVVTMPNMAALDRTDEADAVAAQVMGSTSQQNKATIDRGTMRDVLGSRLVRQAVLK